MGYNKYDTQVWVSQLQAHLRDNRITVFTFAKLPAHLQNKELLINAARQGHICKAGRANEKSGCATYAWQLGGGFRGRWML